MKILFLNAYFYPENIASSHLENDLLSALVEAGHDIDIICPVPTRGISKHVAEKFKGMRFEEMQHGHVRVHRFWAPQEGRDPIIRAFRYLWCNLREYMLGLTYKNVDLIFSGSTPPTQGMIAGMLSKRLGCRFVFSLQDIFPDSLVTAGMTRKGSLLWKLGRKIEEYTYQRSDRIVVIGEDFMRAIIEKGVPEDKIDVVYNWIDETEIAPISREQNILFEKFNLNPNKFYVTYCGNVGHTQNFDLLTSAAKQLEGVTDMHFVIIGEGAFMPELKSLIANKQIINMTLLPFQPYEVISHVFGLGDVGIIISKPNVGISSVPSKTWSIMAAGRPILASFDIGSEVCRIVERHNCGIATDAGDLDAFVEALKYLYKNPEIRAALGNNGRMFVTERLSKKICTEQYLELLNRTARISGREISGLGAMK